LKIYIAGKITGNENYKAEFKLREMVLKLEGHTVLNPAELPEGLEYKEYMHICYAMIDVAEAVSFLSNWESSPGAKTEYQYAVEKGKRLMGSTINDKESMFDYILRVLKKRTMELAEYQKILEYYYLKGYETDYFGGGGVDSKGIYHVYIINYKKDNAQEYKVYEQ